MDSENWRSTIDIDPAGAEGAIDTTQRMRVTGAAASRSALADIRIRDPLRRITDVRPVLHAWDATVSLEVSRLNQLRVVLDGLGQYLAADVWQVDGSADPNRFHIVGTGVDGIVCNLRDCLLTDASFVIERRSVVAIDTNWSAAARSAETVAEGYSDEEISLAVPAECAVTIDGEDFPVFAGSVMFEREARPAGFSSAGVASALLGNITPDAVGRLVCQLDEATYEAAVASTMSGPLALRIGPLPGGMELVIDVPAVQYEVASRRLVGEELYEHVVEFAALGTPGAKLCTISLETPP